MFTGSEVSSQTALANDSSENENAVEVTREVADTDTIDCEIFVRCFFFQHVGFDSLRSKQRELMTPGLGDGMHSQGLTG